jgi:hypothetical protein
MQLWLVLELISKCLSEAVEVLLRGIKTTVLKVAAPSFITMERAARQGDW